MLLSAFLLLLTSGSSLCKLSCDVNNALTVTSSWSKRGLLSYFMNIYQEPILRLAPCNIPLLERQEECVAGPRAPVLWAEAGWMRGEWDGGGERGGA